MIEFVIWFDTHWSFGLLRHTTSVPIKTSLVSPDYVRFDRQESLTLVLSEVVNKPQFPPYGRSFSDTT